MEFQGADCLFVYFFSVHFLHITINEAIPLLFLTYFLSASYDDSDSYDEKVIKERLSQMDNNVIQFALFLMLLIIKNYPLKPR